MIDFKHVEKYRENNRIEAKRAMGGLPYSVWETYSSFANTMGGVILLGVEEGKDKSFHALDLPDPQGLIRKIWRQLNDPRRVNVNILTKDSVRVERVDGKRIVVMEVPRAHRADKPVYIENDMYHGTYRRGGEGDYRCTSEEIDVMRRDAAARSQDMRLLEECSLDVLCSDTILQYRAQMKVLRPGHAYERCSQNEFLIQINAAGTGADGALHPSAAGLLMFGKYEAILREIPTYRVAFKKDGTPNEGEEYRGNLYQFFYRAIAELHIGFPRSVAARNAIEEALVNCLVNANYRERGGVLVEKAADMLRFSNPGAFRIDPGQARAGGVSDSRNKAISRMFLLIGEGAGIGGGIPRMFADWRKNARPTPFFEERFEPERTTLTLPIRKQPASLDQSAKKRTIPTVAAKQMIAEHLTTVIFSRAAQIASSVGLPLPRVRRYLIQMRQEGLVISEGQGRNTVWRLRERAGI